MKQMNQSNRTAFPAKKLLPAAVLCLLAILLLFLFDPSLRENSYRDRLSVRFLDVGQGDSILIRLPGGETMLIDAGTNDSETSLLAALYRYGVKKLDCAVFTHPHEDHIGGADTVLSRFPVGCVLMTQETLASSTCERLLDVIQKKNIPSVRAYPGYEFSLGDAHFTVLAPSDGTDEDMENMNERSIILKMTYGDTSFLFMGDAEESEEAALLSSYPSSVLRADVLKLGHHGSSTSSSELLLDTVSPTAAIASCGKNNSFGHPHTETLKRLQDRKITVFRTDLDGTIEIFSDGKTLIFRTEYEKIRIH